MSGRRRPLWPILLLAATCVAGIVAMLLADGGWDWACFALAASPLALGAWRWRVANRATRM